MTTHRQTGEKVLRCKFCGGKLSEIRTFGDLKVRHCYGCHFDYDENGNSFYPAEVDSYDNGGKE